MVLRFVYLFKHFEVTCVLQLKEMGGGRSRSSDSLKTAEQTGEQKKGFADWMNLMKPGNEEKDHWVRLETCFLDFFYIFDMYVNLLHSM